MTPKEIEEKIIDAMVNKIPVDRKIKDRHITYNSTVDTHDSYMQQLVNSSRGTGVYRTYLIRCYEWLILLKKENVELYAKIKK